MAIAGKLEVLLTSNLKGLLGGLNQAKGAVGKFSASTNSSLGKVGSAFGSLNALAKIAGVGLAAALAFSVKKAFDFEKEMANVKAVSGATGEEFQKLQKHAREMGATTIFSASEAAKGMYSLASAGFDTGEIMGSTRAILDLATATQADLSLVTETVTANIRAFGLQAKDAGRVTNVFSSAIAGSRLNIQRVADAMKFAAPTGKLLGQTLEKTTSVIAALADQGATASQAGTTFRMAMVRLLNPSKEATDILEENGITMEKLADSMHDPVELFQLLGEAQLSNSEAATVLGTRSLLLMNIIRDGVPEMEAFEKSITGTTSASEIAAEQQQTLWGQMKLMKSSIEDAAITIGNQLLPHLKVAVASIREFVARIQETGEVKVFADRIVKLGAALIDWLKPFGLMLKMFAKFAAKYPVVVTGILAIWGALQLLQFHPVILALGAFIAIVGTSVRIFKDYKQGIDNMAEGSRNLKFALVDDIEKEKQLIEKQKVLEKSILKIRTRMLEFAESSKTAAVNQDDAIESINNMNDELADQVTQLEEVDREYLKIIDTLHGSEEGFDEMAKSSSGMTRVLKEVQKRTGGLNKVTRESTGFMTLQGTVAEEAAEKMKLLKLRLKDVTTTTKKTNTLIDVQAKNMQKSIVEAENYGKALQTLTGFESVRSSALASQISSEAKDWGERLGLLETFYDDAGDAVKTQFRQEQANTAQLTQQYLKRSQELKKIEKGKRTEIQNAEISWLGDRLGMLRQHQERLKNMNDDEKKEFIELLNTKAGAQAEHEQLLEQFSQVAMDSFRSALEIRSMLRDQELQDHLERIEKERTAALEASAARNKLIEFDKKQDSKRSADRLANLKAELKEVISNGNKETIAAKEEEIAKFHEENRIRSERIKLEEAAKAEEEKINKEFDLKVAAEKRAAAKADRRWAVIQSGINTAVAVTKLLANPALAIAAGIAGAMKTAFIAGQPLPRFADGGAVPGPKGSPVLAQVEGGETILPTHKMSLSNALASVLGKVNSFQDGGIVGGGGISGGDLILGENAINIIAEGADPESMREITRDVIIPEMQEYARERGTEILQ